jgi:hypothetical protein
LIASINPLLQVSYRKQNAFCLGSGSVPLFAKAIGECLFLLRWLQFCEQQGMSNANLFGIESLDHWRCKLGQTDSLRTICWRFSNFRGDLLDAVLRVFQVEQGF